MLSCMKGCYSTPILFPILTSHEIWPWYFLCCSLLSRVTFSWILTGGACFKIVLLISHLAHSVTVGTVQIHGQFEILLASPGSVPHLLSRLLLSPTIPVTFNLNSIPSSPPQCGTFSCRDFGCFNLRVNKTQTAVASSDPTTNSLSSPSY